jgi:membrane protease YdiL (CAAX protease family)
VVAARRLGDGSPAAPLETAAEAYAHVRKFATGPDATRSLIALEARRAVVLAVLRRPEEARQALAVVSGSPEAAALARVIDHALLGGPGDPPSTADLTVGLGALAVPGASAEGWTADRIRIAHHRRAGDAGPAAAAEAAAAERGLGLRGRSAGLAAAYLLLFAAGVALALRALARARPLLPTLSGAILRRPGPPVEATPSWCARRSPPRCSAAWSGGFSRRGSASKGGAAPSWPSPALVLLFIKRDLLPPPAPAWQEALGTRPRARWTSVVGCALVLVAANLALGWIVQVLGNQIARPSPWSENLDGALLTGHAFDVGSSLVAYVLGAPVAEELFFRGLVYGTLRTRLPSLPSALISAALFALAHGYSPRGPRASS